MPMNVRVATVDEYENITVDEILERGRQCRQRFHTSPLNAVDRVMVGRPFRHSSPDPQPIVTETMDEESYWLAQEARRIQLQGRLTMHMVRCHVGKYYGVRLEHILGRRRTAHIMRPRQVAMYLCRDMTKHTLPEIAMSFAGRDHTTIMHSCRIIDERLKTDPQLAREINQIRYLINFGPDK